MNILLGFANQHSLIETTKSAKVEYEVVKKGGNPETEKDIPLKKLANLNFTQAMKETVHPTPKI